MSIQLRIKSRSQSNGTPHGHRGLQAGAAMELRHNRQQRQIARAASAKSRTCWNPITALQPSARLLDVRDGATTEMGHPRRCRSRRSFITQPGCEIGSRRIRALFARMICGRMLRARSRECRSRISSHISGGLRSRSESQEAIALEILVCGGPRPMMMSTMSTP
jgi:hypothetical protein